MAFTKNKYALPFKEEVPNKAISDPRVHFAHFKHAIDFLLPEGTKLMASAAGTVVKVKVDSKEGGPDPKYKDPKYLNHITIQHGNGEYSYYSHLRHQGALVRVGDNIKEGQPIAISGNTGFTTAPHLHFCVFRLSDTEAGWETLEVDFKEKIFIVTPQNSR